MIGFAIFTLAPFFTMLKEALISTFGPEQPVEYVPGVDTDQMRRIGGPVSSFSEFISRYKFEFVGFKNSFIVATLATILNVYFSALTAYALTVYEWKLREALSKFVIAVMMVPTTVSSIGFVFLVYKFQLTNKLFMFILPAIATPMTVFFMRQYLLASFSKELVDSSRMDGSGEIRTFLQIIVPLMKPAIATQAIFGYIAAWNNIFVPMVILTDAPKKTLPIVIDSITGDAMTITLAILPLIIVYLFLSRYIVQGIALGGVKA